MQMCRRRLLLFEPAAKVGTTAEAGRPGAAAARTGRPDRGRSHLPLAPWHVEAPASPSAAAREVRGTAATQCPIATKQEASGSARDKGCGDRRLWFPALPAQRPPPAPSRPPGNPCPHRPARGCAGRGPRPRHRRAARRRPWPGWPASSQTPRAAAPGQEEMVPRAARWQRPCGVPRSAQRRTRGRQRSTPTSASGSPPPAAPT
mmetsp:Transcript_51471/g.166953  ORF Transcript_51471/g.166953 Transcript_51471/m.166953 type:complete len:204 (-) Transcript_51471:322-933(-)